MIIVACWMWHQIGIVLSRVRVLPALVVGMLFVGSHVPVHITICGECLCAIFTVEWPFPSMNQYMTIKG